MSTKENEKEQFGFPSLNSTLKRIIFRMCSDKFLKHKHLDLF